MYTHKILSSNQTPIDNTFINTEVSRTIFTNDSVLSAKDLYLLQEVPINHLLTTSQFLTNNLEINYKDTSYIKVNNSNNLIIYFGGVKGYVSLSAIHPFDLPPIEITINKPILNEVTLYLITLSTINTLSDKLNHLPITMRPQNSYQDLSVKYSLKPLEDSISYPLAKVFINSNNEPELRLTYYESNKNKYNLQNIPSNINLPSASYITSGFYVNQVKQNIYISSGIIYNQGNRIVNHNTLKLSINKLPQINATYYLTINSSSIWLTNAYKLQVGNSNNEVINDVQQSNSNLIIGKLKVNNNTLTYYELIPRVKSNWYYNTETRLDSILNITSTLLQSSNINSVSNLHITNFKLQEDITHPDYLVSYIDHKYPCPLNNNTLIPFNTLSISSNNLSLSSVNNHITLLGSSNPAIDLIKTSIGDNNSTVLVSVPSQDVGMIMNTPLIEIQDRVLNLTSIICRFRGFRPFSQINSLRVNNKSVSTSSISLGITGNQDFIINNVEGIESSLNTLNVNHEDKEINIPLIDNTTLYLTTIPNFLTGQTFSITNSLSISHIGLYILNTEYIKSLSKYQPIVCSVCVYKVSGNVIETNPFYVGDCLLDKIDTTNFTYVQSQPIISTQLDKGKYVLIIIPFVHPLNLGNSLQAYTGGGRCTITGNMNTISEEISQDLAFSIKGCYISQSIVPQTLSLSLDSVNDIYPLITNTVFKIEDSLNQLSLSNTDISITNNKLDISINLPQQKYICLEGLSLLGSSYTEKGIWVSKPILLNRINLMELTLELICFLPGSSKVNAYISIDSSNTFILLTPISQQTLINSVQETQILYSNESAVTITRYIIIKLEIINDIKEKEIVFIKEAIIKPIT